MSRYPDAYAVCPVCGIHIDIQALKDEESFTGEEATRHIEDAHPEVCTDLGVPYFSIHLSDSPPPKPKRQGPYTDTELRAVFTMARLLLLLDGIEDLPKMNKRAMLRVLMAGPCPTRSRGSLEAKLMNVSGASERIGGPIIPGYKPAPNCQKRDGRDRQDHPHREQRRAHRPRRLCRAHAVPEQGPSRCCIPAWVAR